MVTTKSAPTIATRIPTDRLVPGLDYGPQQGKRRLVRPEGGTLWALAKELPAENLPIDANILDELTTELARWDHLSEDLHPAVAVLLDDGGIRAASEAEEYRAVLPDWAWERLAERLAECGTPPKGTLAGSHVWAALGSFYRAHPSGLASSPPFASAPTTRESS